MMGLQAIEATPKDGRPVFPVDQDTGDDTTAHWAARQGVSSQSKSAIAFSPTRRLPGSKTVEGSRGTSRVVARASGAAGVCVLWLFIGAVGDNGFCGESNIRARAFVAPTEKGRKIAQPNAQRLDVAQREAAQAPQAAPASEQNQAVEEEQARGRAEALVRAASSLRGELDSVRAAAEATRIKQKQALDQERDRADALARELTSLWAELDAARIGGSEAVQGPEAKVQQRQPPDQERDRAEALARELASVRAELDTVRAAGQEAARTAEAAKIEQKQALKQEQDRGEGLARELASVQAELDTARAAGQEAARAVEVAKIEQELALGTECNKAKPLVREAASVRKEVEQRFSFLAAAHAEVLQATETNSTIAAKQELVLAGERDRADALMRELTSVRNELEAANRQIAALNGPSAVCSREPAADSSQERVADSSSGTIEGKERSPEQISGEAIAATSKRSSASESPRPEPSSTARQAAPDLDPKAAMVTERSAVDRVKACSRFEGTERLKCVDELLQEMTPDAVQPQSPNWIISETASPVDYRPQIAARTTARALSQDAPSSLAIHCRAQRTDLIISTTGSWKQAPDGEVKVVYRINEDLPVEQRWRSADPGKSLAFQGDVVRFLRSMPDSGQILVRVFAGKAPSSESTFQLAGLDPVRRKIAAACNWPQP